MRERFRQNLAAEAQHYLHVIVDGELVSRLPWDPIGLAEELQSAAIDADTPCSACGVVAGQLHWPLCEHDWLPDGSQIISQGVTIKDYFRTSPTSALVVQDA